MSEPYVFVVSGAVVIAKMFDHAYLVKVELVDVITLQGPLLFALIPIILEL